MILVAIAAVVWPLWRGPRDRGDAVDAAVATHRLQLQELKRDLENGVLAEGDYAAALRDMQAEGSSEGTARRPSAGTRWRRGSVLVTTSFILLAAPLLYWYYGSWRVGVEGVEAASVPVVKQMVNELSLRLHSTDPDDMQGWEMLGHAYVLMERYPDALDAYGHARKLSGDDNSDVLAGYAEALALADPNAFMDKSLPLFEKALSLDPANPQALWYGGLGAFELGDKVLAVQRWQTLLAQDPPEEYRSIISNYIVEAGGTPGASQRPVPQSAAASSGARIRVHVSLAPALKSGVRSDETLFVFALSAEGAGGPPLAVRRFQAGALPLDVTLTDQDAPIPGRSLSGQSRYTLVARISVSGAPEQHAGDLMGQVVWDKASGKTPAIVIDTQVQ
jgi:cytochrome c-type biogenesis protein CcmH